MSDSCQLASYTHKHHFSVLLLACLILSLTLQSVGAQSGGEDDRPLDTAFQQLNTLKLGQPLQEFAPIELAVAAAQTDASLQAQLEERLLAVLEGDATHLAKEYACRQLAMVGSDTALPTLATLLPDQRLSHMARYALEAIGSPAARGTLRKMLAHTEGPQKTGVVISLGRLSDADAVDAIALLLEEQVEGLREAALVALGRIGSFPAANVLHNFKDKAPPSLRAEVANALLTAAESLREQNMLDQAEKIYQSLVIDMTQHVRAAAYRGLILTRPEQTAAKIREGLASDQDWKREVAADCLVALDQPDQIAAIASSIVDLPASGKIAAFASLQNHQHSAIREAALQSLDDSETEVRTTALAALVSSGTPEDVPRLASLISMATDPSVRQAASQTLRLMSSEGVDRALVTWLSQVEDIDPALIRCALDRRSPEIVPAFLRAAESQNSSTRKEAFAALEIMATADELETLVDLLCKTAPGQEREAASRAIWMACQRVAQPEKCRARLLAGLNNADAAGRCAILPTLARIGGNQALTAVEQAMDSNDDAMREAGYRALANWPDATVAGRLLQIAKSNESEVYRIWALRAYARVVALPSERPAGQTFQMLSEAMKLATRTEDRELIVSRMASVRVPETLELLVSLLDESELRRAAADAVFESAKGLSRSHPQQAREALEKVQPMITNPEILQQLPRVLRDIKARHRK